MWFNSFVNNITKFGPHKFMKLFYEPSSKSLPGHCKCKQITYDYFGL
jgi:hypothetical protein